MYIDAAKLLVIAVLIALSASACDRPAQQTSTTQAIGTDLPDDGGDLSVYLYWTNSGRIFRGRCPDRHDVIRVRCTDDLQSLNYGGFMTTLDGGLSQTIRSLTEESRRIQTAIVRVESQISAVQDELNRLEQQYGHLDAELRRLRADLNRFESFVAEYREQLRLIDIALGQIDDADIAAQRLIVLARLGEYQEKLLDIGRGIDGIITQVGDISSQVDTLRTQISGLTARLSNLQHDLDDVSSRLQRAVDDFSVYEDTLRRLNDGIIYTVMSDNVILARQRQFVRRFDTIFEEAN